ncbi:FimV/HubP family polar landmark protein [Methylotenera sp.]|uniref:FimV/HubP family polar landmark protein n=1 Tax=Methylotenera sp. TaxID=2051956 RepID=UPI002EDBABF3
MAFMPIVGYTAGLGKLNVNSGLGEPLKAEVELLSVTPEELSTLTAAIASEEAYNVQGITRLGIHSNIRVDVAKSDLGAPILRIRSNTPINDPYLDMLIQVDWASGRLLREYTVLLDPPEYKQATNAASDFAPVVKPNAGSVSRDTTTTKPVASSAKKSQKRNASAAKPEEVSPKEAGVGELTTKRGDTLAAIAQKMQVEGVSLDQMLVGLFENNKSAFANANMNQLKVGQIIKAPSVETLTAIDTKQAKQALKVHASNWNAYRNSLAGNVKTAAASEESEPKQSASGKIASAEDKSAAVKPGVQDVVKLSAGDKNAVNSQKAGAAEAEAKVAALQEEAIARENALKESLSRAAALEKQIEDMQKLLALKNQTMTELQKNAEAAPAPVEAKPVAKVEPAKQPPAKPAIKAPPPVVNPAPEPSFFESLIDGLDIKLLGGTSALVVLGAGWLFLRNKRRRELDSFERGILTSGGLRANTVFGNTTGNSSTSDTSFLTDFAQSADGSMIDTNDVDPIAEAEVYMAYGRDAQAEEILKDAIVKEPKRYELHLKLLEMYAGRNDVSAFEAVAGELYTTLGADDPTWAKIAEMGGKLEPDNPLYQLTGVIAPAVAVAGATAASAAVISASLSDNASAESELFSSQDVGLDFSLDDASDTVAEVKADAPLAETFTSSMLDSELSPNSAVMESFASVQETDNSLEFDLGVAEPESVEVAEPSLAEEFVVADESDAAASPDDNILEFTMSSDESPALTIAEPVNAELEASSADTSSFEVPSFLDTAPNIEFSNDVVSNDDLTLPTAPSVADNAGFDFAIEEPVAIEIPDTPMDVSFNTSLDLDKAGDVDFSNLLQAESSTVNGASPESLVEDISFDFSLDNELDTAIAVDTKEPSEELASNDFDFSAISLDLGDDAQLLTENADDNLTLTALASGASENQDVDIKLDLVAAYIDMDDKEGARELLEEVLKEGGPQQKLRAEQLLAGL